MSIPYIMTEHSVALFMNGRNYAITNSHMNWEKIREAIKAKDWDALPNLVDVVQAVRQYTEDKVEIHDGLIYYRGEPLHNAVTEQIIRMNQQGFDSKPLITFLENLLQNPSKTAIDELYLFLEHGKLPITEDGCFLAYKKVRGNYYDYHSGSVLNMPAYLMTDEEKAKLPYTTAGGVTVNIENDVTVVSMKRNQVDDNRYRTCSYGLHFCSFDYLNSFYGARTVVLKINPRDVVSIPSDYNNTKGRTCRYEVYGEIGDNLSYDDMQKAVHVGKKYAVQFAAMTEDAAFVMANTVITDDDFKKAGYEKPESAEEAKETLQEDLNVGSVDFIQDLIWNGIDGAPVPYDSVDSDTVRVRSVTEASEN